MEYKEVQDLIDRSNRNMEEALHDIKETLSDIQHKSNDTNERITRLEVEVNNIKSTVDKNSANPGLIKNGLIIAIPSLILALVAFIKSFF